MQTNTQQLRWQFEHYYKEKKIPLWVFDQNYEVAFTNFTTSAILNLMEPIRQMARSYQLAHSITGYYLNLDHPYEMYYCFSYDVGKHQSYIIIVGPVVTVKPTERIWKELTFNVSLFAEQKRVISHALPVMDVENFKFEITEFYNNILESKAPVFDTISYDLSDKKEDTSIIASADRFELIPEAIDEASSYEDLCKIEDLFRILIINGSTYQLYSMFNDERTMDILFPDKTSVADCIMRTIELLTIAKIASVESGNDHKASHARFQHFASELKQIKNYDKIINILQKGAVEFARNSHDINMYTSDEYSPMTNKCIKRIVERLPDKISLDELAKELHISAKYLSALFNKETGSSITDFMQDLRVNEAKHLLTESDLTYLEISTLLNFSSQSYFNCIFKKKTDLTPKEFREQAKKRKGPAV